MPSPAPLPREAAAVHDALPPDLAAELVQEITAVIDAGRTRPDAPASDLIRDLDTVVGRYWAVASARLSPHADEITERSRRWAEGDDDALDFIPAEQVFGKLR